MNKLKIALWILAPIFFINGYANADWETTEAGPAGPINQIFVGSGGKIYSSSIVSGVYISINNGTTWIERNTGFDTSSVKTTVVRAAVQIGSKVLAGTEGKGIFETTNDGDKWVYSKTYIGNLFVYGLAVANNKVYAGTDEAGVYRTDDNGSTWVSLNDGTIPNPVLAITADNNRVFVGTTFGGLFESTNNGNTWTNINPNVIKIDILCIAVSGDKYFVGTKDGGIFFSNDDGKNWTSINTGMKNSYITSILIKDSKVYAATKGGGVYFTDSDGKSWSDANANIPDMEVWSLAADNTYLYAGTSNSSILRRKLSEIVAPDVQAPELTSPANDAMNTDTAVALTWNPSNGAVSYHVQLAKDPAFTNSLQEKDGLSNTFYTAVNLDKDTKYYWKTAANTVNSEKKWSQVWNFKTKPVLISPDLFWPKDNDTSVSLPATFTWNKASGAVNYQLLVCEDDKFDSLIIFNQNKILDTFLTVTTLKEMTNYYWKVGSIGYDDKRLFSASRKFKSGKTNSVESYSDDGSLMLSCFPNPANGSVSVSFATPANIFVNIKIYDLMGKEMGIIHQGNAYSNVGLVNYPLNQLRTGSYRIVMTSQGKTVSVPLMIVK